MTLRCRPGGSRPRGRGETGEGPRAVANCGGGLPRAPWVRSPVVARRNGLGCFSRGSRDGSEGDSRETATSVLVVRATPLPSIRGSGANTRTGSCACSSIRDTQRVIAHRFKYGRRRAAYELSQAGENPFGAPPRRRRPARGGLALGGMAGGAVSRPTPAVRAFPDPTTSTSASPHPRVTGWRSGATRAIIRPEAATLLRWRSPPSALRAMTRTRSPRPARFTSWVRR